MNDVGAALIQTALALQAFWWLIVIVAAVLFFLMPFFVFRIRNELIDMNRRQIRILALMEAVIPESKKPQADRAPTKICPNCKTVNKLAAVRCVHCRDKFGLQSE